MSVGGIRYCLHADPEHRVRSDLTVWKLDDEVFEVMSGEEADAKSLVAQSTSGPTVEDISAGTAIFAVQGPLSLARILPACEERGEVVPALARKRPTRGRGVPPLGAAIWS